MTTDSPSDSTNADGPPPVLALATGSPVGSFDAYAIRPPKGWDDDDFPAKDSVAYTAEGAWEKFCRPALNRSAYEADGFRAVPVTVVILANTVHEPRSPKKDTAPSVPHTTENP